MKAVSFTTNGTKGHRDNNNMGHAQLSELSETSYELANVINSMVDSSSKQQRTVYDYFLPNSSSMSYASKDLRLSNCEI